MAKLKSTSINLHFFNLHQKKICAGAPPPQPEARLEGVSAQIRLVDSQVHPETPPFGRIGQGSLGGLAVD